MRLRQEQVVFALTVLVLGLAAWSSGGGAQRALRGGGRGGAGLEVVRHVAPDVDRVLVRRSTPPPRRKLFDRPQDTRPLPPLELIEPPLEPLTGLRPPTDPGPSAAHWGTLLRSPAEVVEEPELFAAPELPDEEPDVESDLLDDLARAAGEEQDAMPDAIETPAEREARLEAFRGRYDWIQRGPRDVLFGRIVNEERYGLKADAARGQEPISFVQVDPDTGREIYASVGSPAIAYGRERVASFGFARTPANELELGLRLLGYEPTRATYDAALSLARNAVRLRLEAPRALEIAELLYRRCAAFDPLDPQPRLGLARCHEAGFDLERALAEYQALARDFPQHVEPELGLARLEELLLLHDAAESRLRAALERDEGSWRARWSLGAYLARRGRSAEALPHFLEAHRRAPQEPSQLQVRVRIRTDLGAALLAQGRVAEARQIFEQALTADPTHERALAGMLAVRGLAPADDAPAEDLIAPGSVERPGYELSLALGLRAIEERRFREAHGHLRAAERADPLRSARALAALSYLAARTGHPDEALGLVEQALERDPRDAFALYQRGRLLIGRDDLEGARRSFLDALEIELDLPDALVALGDVAFRMGRFEEMELALERAVAADDARPEVHALRGMGLLRLALVADARASFERSLALEPSHPASLAGLAWCTYLEGDSTEATILLANLDEARRDHDEEDPWRVWAREQIDRIRDHEEKVEWSDGFERGRLLNGWTTRESVGPLVSLVDGSVRLEGVFESSGTTQVFREYAAGQWVSIEASVWVEPGTQARVGLFVARERRRREAPEVLGEVSVSRHKEGGLQVRFVESGNTPEVTDMQQPFPTGRWVRLGIERFGTSSDSRVTVTMDGIPLIEQAPLASLGRASSPVLVGLFAEGQAGRSVRARMDDVAVVHRR